MFGKPGSMFGCDELLKQVVLGLKWHLWVYGGCAEFS